MRKSIPPRWSGLAGLYMGASFLLHMVWENLQAPLYEGYVSFAQHFAPCARATIGDVGFMLVIYGALALAHGNAFWIADRQAYARARTWLLPVFVGTSLALAAEWYAVSTNRWQYGALMPRIPLIGIGATPVLQMIIIPLLVILLMRMLSHCADER